MERTTTVGAAGGAELRAATNARTANDLATLGRVRDALRAQSAADLLSGPEQLKLPASDLERRMFTSLGPATGRNGFLMVDRRPVRLIGAPGEVR